MRGVGGGDGVLLLLLRRRHLCRNWHRHRHGVLLWRGDGDTLLMGGVGLSGVPGAGVVQRRGLGLLEAQHLLTLAQGDGTTSWAWGGGAATQVDTKKARKRTHASTHTDTDIDTHRHRHTHTDTQTHRHTDRQTGTAIVALCTQDKTERIHVSTWDRNRTEWPRWKREHESTTSATRHVLHGRTQQKMKLSTPIKVAVPDPDCNDKGQDRAGAAHAPPQVTGEHIIVAARFSNKTKQHGNTTTTRACQFGLARTSPHDLEIDRSMLTDARAASHHTGKRVKHRGVSSTRGAAALATNAAKGVVRTGDNVEVHVINTVGVHRHAHATAKHVAARRAGAGDITGVGAGIHA